MVIFIHSPLTTNSMRHWLLSAAVELASHCVTDGSDVITVFLAVTMTLSPLETSYQEAWPCPKVIGNWD